MRVAALARTRIPAHNTVDCSKLAPWLAEPRGAPRPGRQATDAPDAAPPVVEISLSDVVKRRTVRWHGIAAEVVQLTRCAKVEIRCCAPRHPLAVDAHGIGQDGETIVQDCRGQNPTALNRMNTPEKSAGSGGRCARGLSRTEEAGTP